MSQAERGACARTQCTGNRRRRKPYDFQRGGGAHGGQEGGGYSVLDLGWKVEVSAVLEAGKQEHEAETERYKRRC